MSDRFEAKSVYEVYSFGFFQGREYEALDTLKAMNAVGDFEVIQRDVVDGFEAVIAARISAAVDAERSRIETLLKDPTSVRVNILRGQIVPPSDLVWLHDTSGPVAGLVAAAVEAEREQIAAMLKAELFDAGEEPARLVLARGGK